MIQSIAPSGSSWFRECNIAVAEPGLPTSMRSPRWSTGSSRGTHRNGLTPGSGLPENGCAHVPSVRIRKLHIIEAAEIPTRPRISIASDDRQTPEGFYLPHGLGFRVEPGTFIVFVGPNCVSLIQATFDVVDL